MQVLLIFSAALLLAVFISGWTSRSVLSTAVLFLFAGIVAGKGGLGLVILEPEGPVLMPLAEVALLSVLFTDSMKIQGSELRRAWRLPGRALLLGLPLTVVLAAAAAHWLVGLGWVEALLVGAVLAPTDPVFAAALIGRREVPRRLRQLLNIESGLNDGLALPIVLILLTLMGKEEASALSIAFDLGGGVLLGIVLPWLALQLAQLRLVRLSPGYEPLFAFAVGLLVFSLAKLGQVNEFLAMFAAGVTLTTLHPGVREAFRRFGELLTELLKLATVFAFGSLISWPLLSAMSWQAWLFAALVLLVARPAALGLVLVGSDLDWRERLSASWFGPKGFASIVYGIMVLRSGAPHAEYMSRLTGLVVMLSIVAHSSTDYLVAKWFCRVQAEEDGDA